MVTSYHVHTTFSDGQNSVQEMIEAAISLGIDEIGISDHYVLTTGQIFDWSMKLDAIADYFGAIGLAADKFRTKIKVRYGIEADFVPETAQQLGEILQEYQFDYVIGSVHLIDGVCIDSSKDYWDALDQSGKNDVIRAYWAMIAKLAKSGLYDIVGHLDLYKKFGSQPTIDISADVMTALDAIAEAGIAIELNTSGWHKPIHEQYPSAAVLRGCQKRGIPVILTADAHRTDDITCDFDRGRLLLRTIGYTNTALFQNRKMTID
ncbi:histidinol-phosphatase [bacterium]|nr:histidinol-phosphatase [bacterium]